MAIVHIMLMNQNVANSGSPLSNCNGCIKLTKNEHNSMELQTLHILGGPCMSTKIFKIEYKLRIIEGCQPWP